MSVFPSWPWTNFNNYNLDWVIKKVKYIEEHIEEIVVDATTDMLDDTLTNPDKPAQAKAAGDGIRANAAQITSVNNSLSSSIAAVDATVQALNSRYLGTVGDVNALTTRVNNAETNISDLGDADEALSDRITALEGSVNAVKDYVFNIYLYTGSNDPFYVCTMEDSPNTINSLLSDLNGRVPVNVKAVISDNGIVSSRVGNLTTVLVGNEIHGVEFDAGEFHCRFLDSNTRGSAYFRNVVITSTSGGSGVYTKGDYFSVANYPADVAIVIGSTSYKVIKTSPGQGSGDLMLAYLTLDNQNELVMLEVRIDPTGAIQFS